MTINCNGQFIDLATPKVMGILNVTPDSFYDGGNFQNQNKIMHHVDKMLSDGATFIDVGAYSSRPDAEHISESEELQRLIPVIKLLVKTFPNILISVDTFRSNIAKQSIDNGACMINDISAGSLDEHMMKTVAKLHVPYIMMHMKGTPQTMKQLTHYEHLVKDVLFYFSKKIAAARALGIVDMIVDPGFGFAKTTAQNFELLNHLELFQSFELPILAGLSRKSMIYKTLDSSSKDALNGTSVLNTIALQKGASILRVHDVKEAVECAKLMNALKQNGVAQQP
jgi:dihydropteroate synthase